MSDLVSKDKQWRMQEYGIDLPQSRATAVNIHYKTLGFGSAGRLGPKTLRTQSRIFRFSPFPVQFNYNKNK